MKKKIIPSNHPLTRQWKPGNNIEKIELKINNLLFHMVTLFSFTSFLLNLI